MTLEDILKIFGAGGLGLIGVIAIPALLYRYTKAKAIAEIEKIEKETADIQAKTNISLVQAVDLYKAALAKEMDENLGKSTTLADLRKSIELRDNRIDEQDTSIKNLVIEIALLKSDKLKQDANIAALTTELANEKLKGATAAAELENLKSSSGLLIEKLTNRVKILEKDYIDHGRPLPSVEHEENL